MAKKMMRMKQKAMKRSMKMKKAAKKSRKMKKRVSKVQKGKLRKVSVFKGTKERTSGGLKKSDLKKNKRGKIVSAKMSAASSKRSGQRFSKWGKQVKKQRSNLKIKGFCPVGGKTQAGKKLLTEVRRLL